ncbi:hypothetical protein AK812_SmicGene17346 [Symbiodinium microadriaticum]|uniref:Uncharacterized protein n=1 Tax=Symbiodinium microadriaticum TaxID=2951 RepID=A0A1Q9DXW3_SYMMI|nr:hypothetical protein AK812_SmicGene17346 [Symbiodinium microadriaticum]
MLPYSHQCDILYKTEVVSLVPCVISILVVAAFMAQFFLHFNIANFVEPVIFGTTEDPKKMPPSPLHTSLGPTEHEKHFPSMATLPARRPGGGLGVQRTASAPNLGPSPVTGTPVVVARAPGGKVVVLLVVAVVVELWVEATRLLPTGQLAGLTKKAEDTGIASLMGNLEKWKNSSKSSMMVAEITEAVEACSRLLAASCYSRRWEPLVIIITITLTVTSIIFITISIPITITSHPPRRPCPRPSIIIIIIIIIIISITIIAIIASIMMIVILFLHATRLLPTGQLAGYASSSTATAAPAQVQVSPGVAHELVRRANPFGMPVSVSQPRSPEAAPAKAAPEASTLRLPNGSASRNASDTPRSRRSRSQISPRYHWD